MDNSNYEKPFLNLAWVTYLSPFTLIVPNDEEPLKVSLHEINSNTYDQYKLCRVVSSVNIELFAFDLLIGHDGAFAIPKAGRFSEKEKAVDFFNNLLCKLLLGGINCEAIDRKDVISGQLREKKIIYPVSFGYSATAQLHSKLIWKVAGIDNIILSKPNFITVTEFQKILSIGNNILYRIPNLTPKFLIKGITEIKYRNWDQVLSNLWITVEQLIDYIWNEHFIKNNCFHPDKAIDGRKSSFKDDNRTWSNSVKQEILFQAGLIDEEIISKLFSARKSRNKLVHEGKSVPEDVAIDLYYGVRILLSKAIDNAYPISLKIDIDSRESKIENSNFDDSYFNDWKEVKNKFT